VKHGHCFEGTAGARGLHAADVVAHHDGLTINSSIAEVAGGHLGGFLNLKRGDTMAKPVSEQLADLSARAKQAEDSVAAASAAAKAQATGMIQEREDEMRAAAAQRKASAQQHATAARDSVTSAWTGITSKVQSDVDGIRARIDYKKYQHDRDKAVKAADEAEENAIASINFALDAIDYAESAVLDAVLARETADSF
jgi:hypothetical protein